MTVLNSSFCQLIKYTCKLINWKHWLYLKLCLQFYYFLERVAHRFYFPSVLLVLHIFVVLVSGWILASSFDWLPIPLQGQDFGQITSVPDHCNFFLYRQTLLHVHLFIYSISSVFVVLCLTLSGVSMMYFQNWFLSQVNGNLIRESVILWAIWL